MTRMSLESLVRPIVKAVEAFGYAGALLAESVFWLTAGVTRGQAVKPAAIFHEMMDVGVRAIPIVSILAFTIGVSLAIQLIYTLSEFGAETQVVLAIAKGVTREFGPLITGVLVAGRSASALAARIGSMVVSQEIDALRVIGIEPVRYLAAPALVALLVMMPTLTIVANTSAILGGGIYSVGFLDMSLWTYMLSSVDHLTVDDITQGLSKSLVFGVLITVVGVSCGFTVRGGAEGVGHSTTRSVVISISCLVVTNMIFTYFQNR